MTYKGRVENGVVVFEGPQRPPEGAAVVVVAAEKSAFVGEGLDRLAGKTQGRTADLAENHDQHRRKRKAS